MICIIPARGGSKGLKNKNMRLIGGKPLIYYTIKTAIKSKNISRIILTTDDKKIVNFCKNFKDVEIPFLRPKNLSTDQSISVDVYLHCIKELEILEKKKIKNFCVLLPTCPLRDHEEIDKCIKIYNTKKLKFLISVKEIGSKKYLFSLKDNYLAITKKKISLNNRQDLEIDYAPNGSIYIMNTDELKKTKTFLTHKTYCYKMNKIKSFDIDDITDLHIIKKFF